MALTDTGSGTGFFLIIRGSALHRERPGDPPWEGWGTPGFSSKIAAPSPEGHNALNNLVMNRQEKLALLGKCVRRIRKHIKEFGTQHLARREDLVELLHEYKVWGRGRKWNEYEMLEWLERMQVALETDAKSDHQLETANVLARKKEWDLSLSYADLHILSFIIDRDLD